MSENCNFDGLKDKTPKYKGYDWSDKQRVEYNVH